MGLVVVFIDIIMIVLFLIFIEGLENSQRAYVSKFKDQTVEMTDFAIRVKNLPSNTDYEKNIEVLRAYLITHFETLVKDQLKKKGQDVGFDDIGKDQAPNVLPN